MDIAGILVIILIIGLAWLLWDTYANGEVEFVKSSMDGKEYLVRSLPDKKEAANLLAQIIDRFQKLLKHLELTQSTDERTVRVIKNLNVDAISEGSENSSYTSYSVNKGEKVVFCLRSRDKNNQLMDINTMMFVALHELAHISSKTVGHDTAFWTNFKWLLENAIQIRIYEKQDFKKKPVEYCGIQITDSPLYH
jgi:hypothetical protein